MVVVGLLLTRVRQVDMTRRRASDLVAAARSLQNACMARALDIYGGRDPRDLPVYSASEAARFVGVPQSTVCAWCFGQEVPSRGARFRPVIDVADRAQRLLSFTNLVELFVLAALTREHRVPLQDVRRFVDALKKRRKVAHPLVDAALASDGRQLLVEEADRVFNVSRDWQAEMRPVVEKFLRRVERDANGMPARMFPFATTDLDNDERRPVVIDPRVAFGQPCIVGTGTTVVDIADRWRAGDSIAELATDFAREPAQIEDAIRYLGLAA